MPEKKIVVPEGMHRAAFNEFFKAASLNGSPSLSNGERLAFALEAVLRWLAENPVVPTPKQIRALIAPRFGINEDDINRNMTVAGEIAAVEWQRRMFLAPEPEVPEEIRDLLNFGGAMPTHEQVDERVLEAYLRGKEAANAVPKDQR